jgi:hypothetical protein
MITSPPRNPNEPDRRTAPGTTAGVIDTIADGMTLVLQRPWLLLVPILVDLVVWQLLRVKMTPMTENAARFIETTNVADADVAADSIRAIGERVYVSDFLGAFIPSMITGMSLDTIMNLLVTFISPTSGSGVARDNIFGPWQAGLVNPISPGSENVVALIGLLSLLGSTIAFALYRVPIARAIRGDRTSSLWKELMGSWVRFLAYLGVLILVGMASLIPLSLLGVVFAVLGLNLTFVFAIALLIFGSMIGLYTYFVVDAMLLHRFGPIQAFRLSYDVGRMYFGQIARFVLTSLFIMFGSLALWNEVVETAPGAIIALVGNAFLCTTLAASSMLFYTDRFRVIRMTRKRAPIQSPTS